jgi:hypothetical protein
MELEFSKDKEGSWERERQDAMAMAGLIRELQITSCVGLGMDV